MGVQEILMILIVAVAAIYIGRRMFRTASGKGGCSSCGPKSGGCSHCSHHQAEEDKSEKQP